MWLQRIQYKRVIYFTEILSFLYRSRSVIVPFSHRGQFFSDRSSTVPSPFLHRSMGKNWLKKPNTVTVTFNKLLISQNINGFLHWTQQKFWVIRIFYRFNLKEIIVRFFPWKRLKNNDFMAFFVKKLLLKILCRFQCKKTVLILTNIFWDISNY